MGNKKLATTFFFNKEKQETPLALGKKLGIAVSNPIDDEPVFCKWGGFDGKFFCSETPDYFIFLFQFWQSDFLSAVVALEEKEENLATMPLVRVFLEAARATNPDVAYVATHLQQASMSFALDLEWAALSLDANYLSDERFGLLYLDPRIAQYWQTDTVRDDRLVHHTEYGAKIAFAGKGKDLWF